jgi:hypothetical protein
MISLPTALNLILCDYLIVEEKTRKTSLIGCFTGLSLPQFPGLANPFSVYAGLTDGFGDVKMQLVVTRLDTGDEVYSQENRIQFTDRLVEVTYHTRLRAFTFPVPSYYQFSLTANGEWVAQRRLHVYLKKGQS